MVAEPTTGPAGSSSLTPHLARVLADGGRGTVGRYVLLEELGRGGMGVVWVAWDPVLRRTVAIKSIRNATREVEHHRFEREATAAASLRHPGIVAVFEVGVHEGWPYIVMEHIDGVSLEVRLRDAPMEPRALAAIVRDVARALEHAHRQGLVHRDVKPENVLIDRDGEAHLGDFGLARVTVPGGSSGPRLTISGQTIGTPAYMAPEQIRDSKVGPRADVWGLGCTLYRALAGHVPFREDNVLALLTHVLEEDAEPLGEVAPATPAGLAAITMRCLQRDAARRYESAAALADDLQRFIDDEPVHARPVGVPGRVLRHARRRALAICAGLVVLTAGTVGGLVATRRVREANERAERAEALAAEASRARDASVRRRAVGDAIARGRERLAAGDAAGAIVALTEALELDPRSADALHERGRARAASGAPAEAIDDLSASLDIAPSAEVLVDRARALLALDDAEGAEADFAAAIELDPGDPAAWLGRAQVRAGPLRDPDGALADATRALELQRHPDAAAAHIARARAHAARGEHAALLAELDAAIAIRPDDIELLIDRGRVRFAAGDREGALDDWTRAIELEPTRVEGWLLRSQLRGVRGRDWGEQAYDLERAVALDPDNAGAWSQLGLALDCCHREAEAEQAFTRALVLDPESAFAWNGRGFARYELYVKERDPDRLRATIEDFDRAIAIDPQMPMARLGRGQARLANGETAAGIEDLERFIELDPSNPQVKGAVQMLRDVGAR